MTKLLSPLCLITSPSTLVFISHPRQLRPADPIPTPYRPSNLFLFPTRHVWGLLHVLPCSSCGLHFPTSRLEHCCYHPEAAVFYTGENHGKYPCCRRDAVRFDSIQTPHSSQGCRARRHKVYLRAERVLTSSPVTPAKLTGLGGAGGGRGVALPKDGGRGGGAAREGG
eukprot:224642-Prorocentrum_minimum.AAC.1